MVAALEHNTQESTVGPNPGPGPLEQLEANVIRDVDTLLFSYHSYKAAIPHRIRELMAGEEQTTPGEGGPRRTALQWSDPTCHKAIKVADDARIRRWQHRVNVVDALLAKLYPDVRQAIALLYGISLPGATQPDRNGFGLPAGAVARRIGVDVQLVQRWQRGARVAIARAMRW